ncbi:peptidylprolyl isomerase [Sagittula salina]|uniref:Parvulin-like PPIase n=1 Tax=Sagittula salina TaxID=2820268 RepID=A0A940MJ72_9RHOB|nr:peptidylprolyl isomerase [Sagittula salina]MBP0482486.1 peptidylprolyl isomerase [Sagittula salina]
MPKTTLMSGVAALSLLLALPVTAETADHGTAPAADHGAEAEHAATGAVETGGNLAVDLGQVVASVNGKPITLGHMIVAKAALPQQYQTIPDSQLWDGLLEQLIQQELLAQSPDAHQTKLVDLSMANERRSLLAAVALTEVAKRSVNEAKVLEIYQRDFIDVEQGKEFNASHILLDTEEEAKTVLAEVKDGADFATAARDKSTGPSGPNGGELGWFGAGMMVEPFQNAVEAMSPGDVVGPVQTQFGWHIIKLNQVRSAEAPLLDDVRGDIVKQIQQEVIEEHIDALTRQADVTRAAQDAVDPSALSRTDLFEE